MPFFNYGMATPGWRKLTKDWNDGILVKHSTINSKRPADVIILDEDEDNNPPKKKICADKDRETDKHSSQKTAEDVRNAVQKPPSNKGLGRTNSDTLEDRIF